MPKTSSSAPLSAATVTALVNWLDALVIKDGPEMLVTHLSALSDSTDFHAVDRKEESASNTKTHSRLELHCVLASKDLTELPVMPSLAPRTVTVTVCA